MTKTIIHIDPDPIFDILGRDGERWGKGWGDWSFSHVTKTCLHGAIRRCVPVKGDAYIIEQVGARFGFGTSFNDEDGWEPVRDRIAQGFDITDDMLEETFGSNWAVVVNVIRTVAEATKEQFDRLHAAWGAVLINARDAAGDAMRDASWDAGRTAERIAAGEAVAAAGGDGARAAVWDVVRAAVLHDLIGRHGFTQEHYDALMAPWIAVFGDPFLLVSEA